jgi:hypothetical protein
MRDVGLFDAAANVARGVAEERASSQLEVRVREMIRVPTTVHARRSPIFDAASSSQQLLKTADRNPFHLADTLVPTRLGLPIAVPKAAQGRHLKRLARDLGQQITVVAGYRTFKSLSKHLR